MRTATPDILVSLREQFPQGARVELLRMDDPQAPPAGALGTVLGVDDTGSIMVRWDNCSGLSVVYGEDVCQRIGTGKSV